LGSQGIGLLRSYCPILTGLLLASSKPTLCSTILTKPDNNSNCCIRFIAELEREQILKILKDKSIVAPFSLTVANRLHLFCATMYAFFNEKKH